MFRYCEHPELNLMFHLPKVDDHSSFPVGGVVILDDVGISTKKHSVQILFPRNQVMIFHPPDLETTKKKLINKK